MSAPASLPTGGTPIVVSDDGARAPLSAWYALAVMVLVSIFAFVDRQVLSILAEPMRHSLGMSDAELGMMQGLGLTLFAVFGSVPLAMLADRFDKRYVFAGCIVVWSIATAACGLAETFGHLFLATIGIAVAEAGIAPIIYSMIPTLFPGRQRATANLIFYGASILGISLGMGLSGAVYQLVPADGAGLPALLQGVEAWRLAMFAVALPAPIFVVLVLLIRGNHRQVSAYGRLGKPAPKGEFKAYVRKHWRSLLGVFGSAGLTSAAFAPILAWLPTALTRVYGVPPGEVGMHMGYAMTAGAVCGIAASMLITKIWRPRFGELLAMKAGSLLSIIATLTAVLLVAMKTAPMVYIVVFLLVTASISYCALLPSLYQAIAPAHLRARVISLSTIVTAVFTATGPLLVGGLSDLLSARPDGLLTAITLVVIPALLLSAGLMLLVLKPLQRTLAYVEG